MQHLLTRRRRTEREGKFTSNHRNNRIACLPYWASLEESTYELICNFKVFVSDLFKFRENLTAPCKHSTVCNSNSKTRKKKTVKKQYFKTPNEMNGSRKPLRLRFLEINSGIKYFYSNSKIVRIHSDYLAAWCGTNRLNYYSFLVLLVSSLTMWVSFPFQNLSLLIVEIHILIILILSIVVLEDPTPLSPPPSRSPPSTISFQCVRVL